MQRAPTLHPGPCLVFIDPAKNSLRYPNLKIKTSLLLQLQLIVSTHSSHTHITVKCTHCCIISSTTSTTHVSSICYQFCIKHIINLYITLLALHLHPQTVIWHITSAALNHHSVITIILYYPQHFLILAKPPMRRSQRLQGLPSEFPPTMEEIQGVAMDQFVIIDPSMEGFLVIK